LYGWPGLACAIIRQAYHDAQSGNGERADALDFLQSPGGADLLANLAEALGVGLGPGDLAKLAEIGHDGQE